MNTQNWKLLTLTLTGNQIGDNGAKSFANVNEQSIPLKEYIFFILGFTLQSNINFSQSFIEFYHG
jgi:hypothetical protein